MTEESASASAFEMAKSRIKFFEVQKCLALGFVGKGWMDFAVAGRRQHICLSRYSRRRRRHEIGMHRHATMLIHSRKDGQKIF